MPAKKKQVTAEAIIEAYMNAVLEHEREPKSVYKFAKEHKMKEADFYKHFGSFDAVRQAIWNHFHDHTMELIQKHGDYHTYETREKLLTYFYTMFEMLTANRSYVLMTLDKYKHEYKQDKSEFKGLRRRVVAFGKLLVEEDNIKKDRRYLMQNERLFGEAVSLQLMLLVRFWANDNSAGFEQTDVAIEKSVNTAFEVFDTTPINKLVDLGKFLYQSNRA